jgi:hypothetical protein
MFLDQQANDRANAEEHEAGIPWQDVMLLRGSKHDARSDAASAVPAGGLTEFRSFPSFRAESRAPEKSMRDLEADWARDDGEGPFSTAVTILLWAVSSLVGGSMLVQALAF